MIATEFLSQDTELFHGSVRLFMITCYLQRSRLTLNKYFKSLPVGGEVKVTPDHEALITGALSNFELFMPSETGPSKPWTKEIVVVFLASEMIRRHMSVVAVSTLLASYIPGAVKENPIRKGAYAELEALALRFDKCRSLRDLDKSGLLDVRYFSVMRLPIQFFGKYDTALRYAKHKEDQLFEYRVNKKLKLLDISDANNVRSLMREKDAPFADSTPYSSDVVRFYAEADAAEVRGSWVSGYFVDYYKSATVREWEEFEHEASKLHAEWSRSLAWSLPARRGTSWDDIEWYEKQDWSEFLREVAQDLEVNQQEVWTFHANRANAKTKSELVDHIRTKFPRPPGTYEQAEAFNDFMNAAYNAKITELSRRRNTRALQELQEACKQLERLFNVGEDKKKQFDDFVVRCSQSDYPWAAMKKGLMKSWQEWFKIELVSPRGLWIGVNFPILSKVRKTRYSSYDIDALLVHSLLQSSWWQERGFHGWVCHRPYEVMVVNPERHGKMVKLTTQFDFGDCDYRLE